MIRFCIILGAAKAGTTSLFHYLARHPEIAPCHTKEPNFFSMHYDKGHHWYLSLWDKQATESQVLLESTVNYTHDQYPATVSARMLEFARSQPVDMKFIYIMRDPFKRLESHYTYNYAHKIKWSLQTALDKGYIIRTSRYAQQLDPFFEKFNPQNFLLLDFDDLQTNPDALLKTVCRFLNINPDFHFPDLHHIHNKSAGKIVTRPIENLYRKHPWLESVAKIFPKRAKLFVLRLLLREKITTKFQLTPQQRKRVHNELKNDMARLHKKYGINTQKWGF